MTAPNWTNKFQGRPVATRAGRNGQTIVVREVTTPCRRCTKSFTFHMTTKPVQYCPDCRAVLKAKKRQRDIERVQASRRDGTYVSREQGGIRKIRFAGHPRSKVNV